jgi:hypothetical protein
MPPIPERARRVGWGLFSVIVAAAAMIAAGIPIGPIVLLCGTIAFLFAFIYPYITFAVLVALIPFSGIMVSIPLGSSGFAERAFGGSIDLQLVDVVAVILMLAWAAKVVFLWVRRGDENWAPKFPLIIPMLGLVVAHFLSAFSPLNPDKVLVVKYALRPVFFSYLAFVVLTANLVRSPRRVKMALGAVAATGVLYALVGLASLAMPQTNGFGAVPLPIFGTAALGDNHNLLAEWLCFSALGTIALAFLSREARAVRLLGYAAALQGLVALLSFARTAWIVMAIEVVVLLVTVWREEAKRYAATILIALLCILPAAVIMAKFSAGATAASSNSTRLMLSEIAVNLWTQSPIVGAGAGTFVTYVSQTLVFAIEFGSAIDSHGFLQKILAETGLIGLIALAAFAIAAVRTLRRELAHFHPPSAARNAVIVLAIAAGGAFVYQLFNTDYWSGKLWFPIGILFASMIALRNGASEFTNGANRRMDE